MHLCVHFQLHSQLPSETHLAELKLKSSAKQTDYNKFYSVECRVRYQKHICHWLLQLGKEFCRLKKQLGFIRAGSADLGQYQRIFGEKCVKQSN